MGTTTDNLDPGERARFEALAGDWWDPDGASRTLHDINPCRLDYVARQADLNGARAADIGCGGGLLSEALARAGARVTGVDAGGSLIELARTHAAAAGLAVEYLTGTAEALAAERPGAFDLVTCMELIEHVPDPDTLLGACAALLVPGGTLVVSTLNRSPRAWALGIVAAEYVLGLVPRGTHDYSRFVRPSELAAGARRHGLELRDLTGMAYDPLTRRARLSASVAVNYFATFTRVPR